MKRMLVVTALVTVAAFATAFSGYSYSMKKHHEKCNGSRSCSICKNCSRCQHCAKNGGSCGACK